MKVGAKVLRLGIGVALTLPKRSHDVRIRSYWHEARVRDRGENLKFRGCLLYLTRKCFVYASIGTHTFRTCRKAQPTVFDFGPRLKKPRAMKVCPRAESMRVNADEADLAKSVQNYPTNQMF